ncbi:ATP-binding protein [Streptococcus suis]|uniref:AAA family ATPase n=1 Tax=Streptococcus suis TaxID=1307 RepID=UPI0006961B2C|nr:AAA family ATPase [Streptococcus suis]NQH50028.1 ATP-binding protein [Streptococcus suis]NQI07580.1 ATP-binding protein [Streptococcus suis]NQN39500.1 ATP-binding protein [Streptococcus suis]NQN41363.1 ATP-binding protein [Streptococcus suis]NQO25052.1 ATP-binding protein [Streptococcus suis]
MKKKGMRLVAMIEEIKSKEKSKEENKEEKYEIINFLPDLKVKHIGGKKFEIEENEDYIKIPYADGIDDLTVIVGENGVGKTRLVNDILSQSEEKLFIYRLGKDKYIYLQHTDKDDRRRTGEQNFVNNNELELTFSSKIGRKKYNATGSDFKELQIVKFSNSIEKEGGTILLDLSKDVSTTKLLERNKHRTVVLEDMKNQISFIKELMEKETDLEKLFNSHPILRPIISNKQIVIAFRNTIQEVNFNQEWKFLAQRQLSYFKNRRARFIQYFFDILIYIVISNKKRKINDHEYNQELFNLFVKQTHREVPSYYYGQEIVRSLLKNSREEQGRELEKRLQAGDSKAKEFWDKVVTYNSFFEHTPHGKEMISNYESGSTKQKNRLGNAIKTDKVFEELRAIEGINAKVIEHLVSLYKSTDLIDTTNDIDQFSKIQQLLGILSKIEGENYILKNTEYKNIIDRFMGEIIFSWDGLSSGELALLNLFGRLFSIKKGLKANNILLLLDEVDLGLHPEWQRRWISVALPIIKEIFKGKHIQIIMTTHSPIMLSDIYADNVIMLRKDTNGNRIIVENQGMEKNQVTTFGQNIHDLYRDSFFLDSTRGEYAKEQIQETTKVLYELELWQDEESRIFDIYKGKCKERYKELFASDTDDLDKKIDEEAFEVWFSHRSQIEKDIENIKKISNEEEYANLFYEKYYKTKDQGKFTDLFKERFNDDKQIIEKLKSGEIIFPEFNRTNYKDEYKTQYREKYIKLRDDILNNSFIREKIQKSSSDDRFKQILKYRIDAIGEQLIKRKLLSMWDKIWFSETVPEISSGNSELLQQIREVFATNKQVLLKVSEIEELINSHNGEE